MVDATAIRNAIGEYLSGKYSFDGFENWMIANTRSIHSWGDPYAKDLASSVNLKIAEYLVSENDRITEKDLRSELQALANTYPQMQTITIITGTSTHFTEPQVLRSQTVGRLFSTASVLPLPR